MSTISLTMPLEADELIKNGEMLLEMASSLNGTFIPPLQEIISKQESDTADNSHIEKKISASEGGTMLDGSEEAPAPTVISVDLDSAGLPWDARIHGAKKLKTAKDDLWKKIRGVDPELVKTVEAELRAALAASPADPVVTEEKAPAPQTVAPPPKAEEKAPAPAPKPQLTITPKYVTPQGNYTEDELVAAGWTEEQVKALPIAPLELTTDGDEGDGQIDALSNAGMTFPEFMAKVTREQAAGEIDQAAVLAAVNAAGLASLPLLATRPDLIPEIDTALFGE